MEDIAESGDLFHGLSLRNRRFSETLFGAIALQEKAPRAAYITQIGNLGGVCCNLLVNQTFYTASGL